MDLVEHNKKHHWFCSSWSLLDCDCVLGEDFPDKIVSEPYRVTDPKITMTQLRDSIIKDRPWLEQPEPKFIEKKYKR